MASGVTVGEERSVAAAWSFLHHLFGDYHPRDFAVRFWDGTTWRPAPGQPARFTLVLQHPGALRRMFWPPSDLTLGEAYIYDDFDIEGEIDAVFRLVDYLIERRLHTADLLRYSFHLLNLPSGDHERLRSYAAQLRGALHSKARDRQAVTYHYDVSNDFYKLWLDKRMVYSCAYFEDAAGESSMGAIALDFGSLTWCIWR